MRTENLLRPALTAIQGDGMSADDAAWAEMAATAERMLMLPGLSPSGQARMRQMVRLCQGAAGLQSLPTRGAPPASDPKVVA